MSLRQMSCRRAVLALPIIALASACGAHTVDSPPTHAAASIRVEPSTVSLVAGADSQLVAVVSDAAGTVLPNQDVRWNTINGAVVSVTPSGVVHAIAPGTAEISAVTGAHLATTKVTVFAPPSAP